MMFVSIDQKTEKKWKNYTLVMPCVSVGNVGQLAADLVINTLYMTKAGCFYHDSIIPVVGNNPFAVGDSSKVCQLMTAAEVFESDHHKLVVVQMRSSLVPGKKQEFMTSLQQWIETSGFSQVVILSSSFAHERIDTQLHGSQLRYVQSVDFSKTDAAQFINDTLKWRELENRPVNPAFRGVESGTGDSEQHLAEDDSNIFIPGGGYAKSLLQKCISSHVPAIVLMRFCSEGDNVNDALEMASMLNSWLSWIDMECALTGGQKTPSWRIPSSWRLQYGSGLQQILFQ